jgi:hypothetical protein
MIRLQCVILLAASYASAFAPPGTPEHALASWVKEEGGFISDVACGERDGVRGLYATKDVPKGALLLSVPEACCIAADEDPQWGLSLRELTTARLVGSLTRGEHAPYIATLPSDEPLLCDWSDAELAELQSPRLADDARGMLPFLDESTARILPWTKGTEADVRWAERMVRSRALLFDDGGFNSLGDLDSPAMMALVPLLDLANHRTPDLGEVEPVAIDVAAKAITLAAPRDLKEGEEVTICYRYEGNEKLLLDYGFAEALNGQPCYEEINLGDDLILDSTIADTCALDDLGATRFRELVEASLAAPTTLAEDRAMLSESTTLGEGYGMLRAESVRLFHALTYRIGQKALMTKMLEALESDNPEDALETVRLCM